MRVFFVSCTIMLTLTFLAAAITRLFSAECDRHVWTEIEMSDQPCVRVYRTIYPSDYLACGCFGLPVRNFHYWSYDMSHVTWLPPASALLPAVPGYEDAADSVPELMEQPR